MKWPCQFTQRSFCAIWSRRRSVLNYSNFKVRVLLDKFLTKDFLRKLKDYLSSVVTYTIPSNCPI